MTKENDIFFWNEIKQNTGLFYNFNFTFMLLYNLKEHFIIKITYIYNRECIFILEHME